MTEAMWNDRRHYVLPLGDCDFIAGMACGQCGAFAGEGAIPKRLRDASDKANRR